jgi:hypothetical protein
VKNVETLGTENAKAQTSKSTSTIRAGVYLSAETVGTKSQKRTSNGKKRIEYADNA